MDFDLVVEEILARVSEKLASVDAEKNKTIEKFKIIEKAKTIEKAKILILTEHHGIICHDLFENSNLHQEYLIDCALQNEYNCDLNNYEAIVIYSLSIDALSKLALGVCDTPFISLAARAILMGKKIFVPTQEIELYTYKLTAPYAYYSMMNEKLNLLKASGVIFCRQNELEKLIAEGKNIQESTVKEYKNIEEIKSATIDKKVIIESDIKKLFADGVTKICISSNAILTDLAKDYIHEWKIEIERESLADKKQRKNL